MIKRTRFSKIFPGWWTVIAGGIICLWGYGFHTYGFSALFKPMSQELGFSRAAASVAASIARFEGGIESPIVGWITDRFGPRWIVLVGLFLGSLGLILMNWVNSLWAYYVVWGVLIGTGTGVALGIPMEVSITNWFVKKRGIALSIRHVMNGLSGSLVMPLVAWLIITQGWRMACVIGGVVLAVVGIPLAWFFIRERRPEYYGLLPDGATTEEEADEAARMIEKGVEYATEVEEVEFTVRQQLKTAAYWILIAGNTIHGLFMPVMSIHCIPFLTDMGISPMMAAAMMSVYITASLPARFVGGLIADRMKKGNLPFVLGGAYLLQAIGITVFLLHQNIAMIYVWFILYGIGMGIGNVMASLMRARYFGRKAFGSAMGVSSLISAPFGVLAPVYVGWVYDTTGSYMTTFIWFAVTLAFGAVIILFARPPKPPAQVTDIHKFL